MKKILFVLGLMMSLISLKAQITYHDYLDSICEWRYYNCCPDWGGGHRYKTQYFDGDSLINGVSYYRKRTCWKYRNRPAIYFEADYFLREDSGLNFIGYYYKSGVFTMDTLFKFDSIIHLNNYDSFPKTNFYNPIFNTPNSYYSKCVVVNKDSF